MTTRESRGKRAKHLVAAGGLALLGSVAGCDANREWMLGGQAIPAEFRSNGERIYFTGTSASGNRITFSGGNMHMQMHGGGCVACHGSERNGGVRAMPRFWVVAPPVTPDALFGDHHEGEDAHGDHKAYTEAGLRRAITQGIDPAGHEFDEAMPRWSMSPQDLDDLVAFLRGPESSHDADSPNHDAD